MSKYAPLSYSLNIFTKHWFKLTFTYWFFVYTPALLLSGLLTYLTEGQVKIEPSAWFPFFTTEGILKYIFPVVLMVLSLFYSIYIFNLSEGKATSIFDLPRYYTDPTYLKRVARAAILILPLSLLFLTRADAPIAMPFILHFFIIGSIPAIYLLLIQGYSFWNAIKNSWKLTKGRAPFILGNLLLFLILRIMLDFGSLLGIFTLFLLDDPRAPLQTVIAVYTTAFILPMLIKIILEPLQIIFTFAIFVHLLKNQQMASPTSPPPAPWPQTSTPQTNPIHTNTLVGQPPSSL